MIVFLNNTARNKAGVEDFFVNCISLFVLAVSLVPNGLSFVYLQQLRRISEQRVRCI